MNSGSDAHLECLAKVFDSNGLFGWEGQGDHSYSHGKVRIVRATCPINSYILYNKNKYKSIRALSLAYLQEAGIVFGWLRLLVWSGSGAFTPLLSWLARWFALAVATAFFARRISESI